MNNEMIENKKKIRNERDKKLYRTSEESRLKRLYRNSKSTAKKFITETGKVEDLLFLQELLEKRLKEEKNDLTK